MYCNEATSSQCPWCVKPTLTDTAYGAGRPSRVDNSTDLGRKTADAPAGEQEVAQFKAGHGTPMELDEVDDDEGWILVERKHKAIP